MPLEPMQTGTVKARVPEFREVRSCPECGTIMIATPVLICTHCGERVPLRSFVYSPKPGRYIAECVDLDLLSQGTSLEEVIRRLQEAMFSYVQVAFDGGSTKGLILRPSPLSHRIRYHFHRLLARIKAVFRGKHRRHFLPESESGVGRVYLSHC